MDRIAIANIMQGHYFCPPQVHFINVYSHDVQFRSVSDFLANPIHTLPSPIQMIINYYPQKQQDTNK